MSVTASASMILLALLTAAGGCNSNAAVNCSDIVFTPGGPAARACVHEVPNGATVAMGDGGVTIVTLNGKVVSSYPPCPCPVPDASSD